MKKYLKAFTKAETTKNYELWTDSEVCLYFLKKRASKRTIILLNDDGTLLWEQLYPFGGVSRPSSVKQILLKPVTDKELMPIVILRGKPLLVKGLDNNIYVSSKERYSKGKILFMNYCDFKSQFAE